MQSLDVLQNSPKCWQITKEEEWCECGVLLEGITCSTCSGGLWKGSLNTWYEASVKWRNNKNGL